MRLTIHQPNFFPWLPFWDKMATADAYVILTQCQYEHGGFQNRFFHPYPPSGQTPPMVPGRWYAMPVEHRMLPLSATRYRNPRESWERIKLLVAHPALDAFDADIGDGLALTNARIIRRLAGLLGIKTRIEVDFPTAATGTARLVEICKHFGASAYIAGASGAGYMDMKLIEDAGITVEHFHAEDARKKSVLEVL